MKLPDLQELIDTRSDAHALRLTARRLSRAPGAGLHRSSQRGRGLEFQEVREYVSGDDPRTIDWRVTARRGRPHTKLFCEERERPMWLMADLGSSMYFGSRVQLKSVLALRAAAHLAWAAALAGDRVGGVVSSATAVRIVPPRSRALGTMPLLSTLVDMQPTAPALTASSSMATARRTLASVVRPGSLVLVLSDFSNADSTDRSDWAALGEHNDLRLFLISDPLERHGLPDGRFRIGWPGGSRLLDGAGSRDQWLAQWREREQRVAQLARDVRARLVQLNTQQSVGEQLRDTLAQWQMAA